MMHSEMATILEKIDADRTTARKAHDIPKATFLGFVLSQGRGPGKNNGNRESTEDEVVAEIRKIIKANDETLGISTVETTNQHLRWQNKILNDYLPEQLTEARIEELIRSFLTGQNWTDEKISLKDMGPVMSMLKDCYPGQYNPKTASDVARKVISELAAA